MDNNEGILPAGTTYKLSAPLTITDLDAVTGESTRNLYPAGTEARILKHKVKREGAYRYVDYVVELPGGAKMETGGVNVHRILGIPKPKLNK